MIANVLAATLASYLWGFKTEDISLSLQTFIPSAAQTRTYEYLSFKKFKVLIDFAHNARVMQVSKTICKSASHQKLELLLVLVTVVMKILKNVQNCRTHV
jgi:UDP-N-acetylmuramyl tripeptide synthase